jgi:hypothetical protein
MQKLDEGHDTVSSPSIRFASKWSAPDQLDEAQVNASPKLSNPAQAVGAEHATAFPTFGSDPPWGVEACSCPALLQRPPANWKAASSPPSMAMQNEPVVHAIAVG